MSSLIAYAINDVSQVKQMVLSLKIFELMDLFISTFKADEPIPLANGGLKRKKKI